MLPEPLTDLLVVQYMDWLAWQVLNGRLKATTLESCGDMFDRYAWWLWSSGGDA